MNPRTGDILIWRSTGFYDTLSDVTAQIKGLHSGLILVGKNFSKYSVCGKSPSHTYVTFLIDRIFPLEEIVGNVWFRHNGAALYHIRRKDGPDVDEDLAIKVLDDILQMKKLSIYHSIYIAIAAYFRAAGVAPGTGYQNRKWQVCSLFIGYFLERLDLLSDIAVPNNLLPLDFYNLKFYQRYDHERIQIFDKGTYDFRWWFTQFLINAGQIQPEPISNERVNSILKNYNWPQAKRIQYQSTQTYLTDNF